MGGQPGVLGDSDCRGHQDSGPIPFLSGLWFLVLGGGGGGSSLFSAFISKRCWQATIVSENFMLF